MNEQNNQDLANFSVEDETVISEFLSQPQKDAALNVAKVEDEPDSLQGTLIDFLDHIQGGLKLQVESIVSSSTIEELQGQQAQIKYRRAWLKALLNEADRELERLDQIIESEE